MSQLPFDPTPRAVLLDLDDTLCDYAGARQQRLRLAFSDVTGLPPDSAALESLVEASIAMQPHGADHFAELFAAHGIGSAEGARRAATWYRENRFYGLALFPDAVTVLGALRGAGSGQPRRPIGIITNGPADVQADKVALLQIGEYVDFVIISGVFGVAKPDPAIFAEALRRTGSTPDETIFVGDSADHDIAGAHAAGLRSVWISRTGVRWARQAPGPDRQIEHIGQLPALFNDPADR
ncbi:MAG: HAD family hydrolase [Thermomicrobiales bacterium]